MAEKEIDWRSIYPHSTHRWNMGLRRGDAAAFFAPGDDAISVRAQRAHWLAADPDEYAALTPDAAAALDETVALARSWGADIDPKLPAFEKLLALGRAWESDFVWMQRGGNGEHRLVGGVVCFPSQWALRDKLGRTMNEIHDPVPDLNATLGKAIEAFLAKQQPGEAWVRENVNFSSDAELNHHPSRPHRPIDAGIRADEFRLRFEHQLSLKLPASGSVLFAIRIEIVPLSRVVGDSAAAGRLAEIIATMSPAAGEYKGIAAARSALVALCAAGNHNAP